MYVMHACMLAAKGGIWFSTFSSFFLNKEKGEREREKKREKDTKNQMRFSRFYDICGWVEK